MTRRRLAAGFAAGLLIALIGVPNADAQSPGLVLTSPTVAAPFSPVVLTGTAQTTTASMSAFTATDLTLTGAGWHITVAATKFCQQAAPATCAVTPKTLPVGSLDHAAPTVAGTAPLPTVFAPTGIDGSSAKLVSAPAGTGAGTYTFGTATLTLRVPPTAFAATYFSTLTYTMTTGP